MSIEKLTGFQLTPLAQLDVEEIWLFGRQMWSAGQADRYIEGLNSAFLNLVLMPRLARERLEFNPPVQLLSYNIHTIAYRIVEPKIIICRVLGGSQDWQLVLRSTET